MSTKSLDDPDPPMGFPSLTADGPMATDWPGGSGVWAEPHPGPTDV